MSVSSIQLEQHPPQLEDVTDNGARLDKDEYERKLKRWQARLRHLQSVYYRQGLRAVIVFEGWDAAGKGGAIRRISQVMDPRGFRVYPIGAPTRDEQSRHYLYRFQKRLPPAGCIAVFDRSYYGRVLVERVESLTAPENWQRAYQEINEFERLLHDDGVRVLKFFLHISPETQKERLCRRLLDPSKQWKIGEEDLRNVARREDYTQAINDMLRRTSTRSVPWQLIAGDDKRFARTEVLKHLVLALEQNVDLATPHHDPEWVAAAMRQLD